MSRKRKTNTGEGAATGRPLRTIAYLRVSTDLQADKGMGLDVQRESAREYAHTHGLELVEIIEEAASGGVREGELFSWEHRPMLLDLLERAKSHGYQVLLVARLDRLSRDYATLIALERQLARHNVQVLSVAEENGDGPVAAYLRGNLALIAELERAMIRERLSAGKAVKKRRGGYVGGRPPCGYRSEGGTLLIDDEAAKIVRHVFELAKDGLTLDPPHVSPAKIANELNREQMPAPSSKPDRPRAWSRQVVGEMLRNRVYTGEMHGVKRAHAAIVSARLFNEINRALRSR
jgi:site-specific DNA recombinase